MPNRRIQYFAPLFNAIYSAQNIANRQIKEYNDVKNISDTCTVTIIKYQHMEYNERSEYVLDAGQIEQLKELILESSFTRDLSNWITFNDRDIYDIQVDFNNRQDFISIHCIGNEYISVINQFDDKHLRINNPNWKESLEEIIKSAEAN